MFIKFETTVAIQQDLIFVDDSDNVVMVLVYDEGYEEYMPMS